ncbi:MAG: hypothetical protein R3200_12625 [Xanthomonadales bacterium]|nr:hypothetical protein [Xanthomonadales bacterium]
MTGRFLGILTGLVLATAGFAEVVSNDADGFVVKHEVQVENDAPTAFRLFADEVGQWWSAAHTFSGDASNLSIDSTCFCETWDDNRVEHLRVVHSAPGNLLRMKGGLGPLQALAVVGSMDVRFSAIESGGTAVSLTYAVVGQGLEDWAPAVDQVLAEQMAGFDHHATTGRN